MAERQSLQSKTYFSGSWLVATASIECVPREQIMEENGVGSHQSEMVQVAVEVHSSSTLMDSAKSSRPEV